MSKNLFEQQGYVIKIVITETFNLNKAKVSEDTRDLGVFFHYMGAVNQDGTSILYEKDPYVLKRLEFPYTLDWNPQFIKGFYGPEEGGTWAGPENTIHLKDPEIGKAGLKIEYRVPEFLESLNSTMRIFVNNELLKEIPLSKAGVYTDVIDVSQVGRDEQEYLEKAQRILKVLLKDFDRVCRKYNLHYYLICGSLLGAVRHKDLIPWDDDVDVAMPRKDFDILLKYAKEEWGPDSSIMFLNYDEMQNHSFLDYMTRIVYMKEEIPVNIFRKIKGKGRSDVDNHLPMDIYVLDNASDREWFHQFQTQFIRGLYGLAMGHRAYIDPSDYSNRDEQTQKIVKILSTIGKYIPLSMIFVCYEWVRKWNKNKKCENYFESNGFIYCIPWKFKQEWFKDGTRLKLGELEINAPENYKAFLKMHYEDFTMYPPMEARKPTHSIEASGIF